jgi:putative PIN family toxin of toxin-antitoxin system
MNYVIDTNVVVAGIRSPSGASASLLKLVLTRSIIVVCSVPLFLEYEAVLLRPEQLNASGLTPGDITNFLDVLAGVVVPVEIQFLWRPQLRDPNDDMVLELAVNALGRGEEARIITFNHADFSPQIDRFGLRTETPQKFFERKRRGITK